MRTAKHTQLRTWFDKLTPRRIEYLAKIQELDLENVRKQFLSKERQEESLKFMYSIAGKRGYPELPIEESEVSEAEVESEEVVEIAESDDKEEEMISLSEAKAMESGATLKRTIIILVVLFTTLCLVPFCCAITIGLVGNL